MTLDEEAATYAAAVVRGLVQDLAGAVIGEDGTATERIEAALRSAVFIGAALQTMSDGPLVALVVSRSESKRPCVCGGAGKLVELEGGSLLIPHTVQCPHCKGTGKQLCGCTTVDVRCPSRREPS